MGGEPEQLPANGKAYLSQRRAVQNMTADQNTSYATYTSSFEYRRNPACSVITNRSDWVNGRGVSLLHFRCCEDVLVPSGTLSCPSYRDDYHCALLPCDGFSGPAVPTAAVDGVGQRPPVSSPPPPWNGPLPRLFAAGTSPCLGAGTAW